MRRLPRVELGFGFFWRAVAVDRPRPHLTDSTPPLRSRLARQPLADYSPFVPVCKILSPPVVFFAMCHAVPLQSSKKGGGEREFNGLIDVYRKTLASDGIAGLYRGFVVSCVGIVAYRGCYFGFYDSLKPVVLVGDLKGSFLASFLLGWVVTIASGIVSYPLDTIRRRMMMTSGQAVKYKSSIDCGMQIIQKEGVKSLFKGAGANVLRGIAGAGVLSGFEKLQEYYIAWRFSA